MAPQSLDDRLGGTTRPAGDEEHREHRAWLRAAHVHRRPVPGHLEVAQQPELQRTPPPAPRSPTSGAHQRPIEPRHEAERIGREPRPESSIDGHVRTARSPSNTRNTKQRDYPHTFGAVPVWKHRGHGDHCSPGHVRHGAELVHAWWRAANYLSVGQIYLLDNPLLREPLTPEHVKPRLLGHWGTTPGLNLIYAHLNRVIRARDLDVIYMSGPGHGGPGMVANTYLEGTYSEVYPTSARTRTGCASCSGSSRSRVGSRATPPRDPGSIHEGGELGYALAHAYGAAFDNPDLVVACVDRRRRGRDRAAGRQLALQQVPQPVTDGAVLPILHLNGYKIANPTVLARIPDEELVAVRGLRLQPDHSWRATTRRTCTSSWPTRSTRPRRDRAIQQARGATATAADRPRWPMIILRTPEGLDRAGGRRQAGRGHLAVAPGAAGRAADNPEHLACWRSGCAATGPRSCSTTTAGSCGRDRRALAPRATGG